MRMRMGGGGIAERGLDAEDFGNHLVPGELVNIGAGLARDEVGIFKE
jgi:hypothetical protein